MVEGRLRKFFEESTLLKQAFVMDSERTVEAVLKDAAKDLGGPVIGDGIRRLPARRGHPEGCGSGVTALRMFTGNCQRSGAPT